jgi:hypothetical protein
MDGIEERTASPRCPSVDFTTASFSAAFRDAAFSSLAQILILERPTTEIFVSFMVR